MIKKIKIYITLAAVAFSSVSCLDKYPEDAIPEGDAIRTVEEANQAVIGIYAYMKNPNLYSGCWNSSATCGSPIWLMP